MADDDDNVSEVVQEDQAKETPVSAQDPPLDPPKYDIRPVLGEKFKAEAVQYIIMSSMQEQLMGRQYRADQAPAWTKNIANGVRARVQGLDMKRYKIMVQTTLLEMKGAGVKCGQRCVWDPDTDAYVDDLYRNDSLVCHTIVYGVYMY